MLGLQLALFPEDALEWIIASLGCAAGLLALTIARRDGLGMGDVKLGLLLGAGLGADVAPALLIGFLALWPVALAISLRHGIDARKRAVPLSLTLALGAAIVLLLG